MTTTNESSKPTEGGPAFPHPDYLHTGSAGMTLRDFFATSAIPGLLAESYDSSLASAGTAVDACDIIARSAYRIADAMLKARG